LARLQKLWISQIGGDMPPRDFLLYPDVHGLLLASVRPGSTQSGSLLTELQTEYLSYQVR
jgi:hypothetical protein